MSRAARPALAALIAALLASPIPAAAASTDRPALVLSYYSARDLGRIVGLLGQSPIAADVPVWYGNYYGTSPPRKPGQPAPPPPPPVTVPNGHPAPIFPFYTSKFWNGRQLPKAQRALAGAGPLAGAAPPLARLLAGSAASRLAWGRELGERFRDRVRQVVAQGKTIDGWQFDEIPSNAIGPQGRRIRELVRGMLAGLQLGRPQLGDRPEQGIVFMANRALQLTSVPRTAELAGFWSTLARTTSLFVGEEYPKFTGDPERAAYVQGAGQRHLAAGTAAMRALASRYAVGITPGFIPAINLGGNVDGKAPDGAVAWRAAFLDARARMGIAGFAVYNLRAQNSRSGALAGTLDAIGEALGFLSPPTGGTG